MINKLTLPLNGTNTEIELMGQSLIFLGANGSGKTRLGSWIELTGPLKNLTNRISAQKSLTFPDDFNGNSNLEKAEKELRFGWGHDTASGQHRVGHKYAGKPETHLVNDFNKLLSFLFAEYNNESTRYREESKVNNEKIEIIKTRLDIIKEIWENILPGKELVIIGNNIKTRVKGTTGNDYNASQMSDGERVIFYLIGQVLATPDDGIVIIDEPELHLHKSVQNLLWKEIEESRKDCFFIYFSHDIDFVSSKVESKKVWLKSYDGTHWDWEEYNHIDGIPNKLELEILGTRQKVLFIEGETGSLDIKIYQNIFSSFLVKPVGSCENVMKYTDTFRNNPDFSELEVYGLIDRDRRTDLNISRLNKKGVFVLEIAEIENIFIVPEILNIVSDNQGFTGDEKRNEVVVNIFDFLNTELELQVTSRVADKITYLLSNQGFTGNDKKSLNTSYKKLIDSINIDEFYIEEEKIFKGLIDSKNYLNLLKFYNRKSLTDRISGEFGLTKNSLQELIIRKLSDKIISEQIINGVKIYIPSELVAKI